MSFARTTACLIVLIGAPTVAHAQSAPACPVVAIDSAGMMHDVFRLADDSMRGRRVGTPEGAKARDFIAARFDALGLDRVAPGRVQPFAMPGRSSTPINGFNVVGTVIGSRFPDQYIVVSAHFDHIGSVGPGAQCRPSGADSICNGADDNASGTAGLLALAALSMRSKPQHTLVFVAFDAEESGDVGSQAWVTAAPIPLQKILIDVNMDMVGRNAKNELYAAGPTQYPSLRPLVEAASGVRADQAPDRSRRSQGTSSRQLDRSIRSRRVRGQGNPVGVLR